MELRTSQFNSLEIKITILAHELKLEGKEVGQNPSWLHGLSSWLADILTQGILGRKTGYESGVGGEEKWKLGVAF